MARRKRNWRLCRHCKRPLRSLKSRGQGFGPRCAKKYAGTISFEKATLAGQLTFEFLRSA